MTIRDRFDILMEIRFSGVVCRNKTGVNKRIQHNLS